MEKQLSVPANRALMIIPSIATPLFLRTSLFPYFRSQSRSYMCVMMLYPSAWIDLPLTSQLASHSLGRFFPQKTVQCSFFFKPDRNRIVTAHIKKANRHDFKCVCKVSDVPLSAGTWLASGKRMSGFKEILCPTARHTTQNNYLC